MSICISGVSLPKMPDHFKQGEEVPYIDIRIFASGDAVISKGERPYFDEFKAIELPPHGDLIDREKIPFVESENGCQDDYAFRYDINELTPVIPAEEE